MKLQVAHCSAEGGHTSTFGPPTNQNGSVILRQKVGAGLGRVGQLGDLVDQLMSLLTETGILPAHRTA